MTLRPGRRWRIVAAILALLVGWGVATNVLFLHPFTTRPEHADAVVVLSGDHGERLPRALALLREGVSSHLVLAGEPDMVENIRLCGGGQWFEVTCLRPNPDNTRTEAQAVGRLAGQRRWRSVIVVTSTQHVARAGLVMSRCMTADVHMVAAQPPFGTLETVEQVAREWPKWIYTKLLARKC